PLRATTLGRVEAGAAFVSKFRIQLCRSCFGFRASNFAFSGSGPPFRCYWTKVQYTVSPLYARSSEKRVTREELFLTLHATPFPRPSIARSRYYSWRQDGSDKTRIFHVIDPGFFARSAIEPGCGATTTQQAGSQ